MDISNNEFDRSQGKTLADLGQETFTMEKNCCEIFENGLFQSLKLHIDSQYKLNQLNQSRIRSFERFRRYCQRVVASFGDGTATVERFDLEQFRNEYNRFDRNYRYWRKRIRKLRKHEATNSSNPYDILYELYGKIDKLDHRTVNKNESANLIEPSTAQNQNDIEISKDNFSCFVSDCLEKFSTQHQLLDHLFEKHSRGEQENTTSSTTITRPRTRSTKVGTTTTTKKQPTSATKTKKPRKCKVTSSKKKSPKTSSVTKSTPKIKSLPARKAIIKREKAVVDSDLSTEDASIPPTKKTKTKKPKKQSTEVLFCEVEGCEYNTTNSWLLKVHKVTHSTDRPFKCDKCELAFKIKGDLKVHQNVHEGRRFRCTFEGCTVNYATQRRIRKHIKIFHTKEAPLLRCHWEGCSYTSYNSEYLKIHLGVHNGDRPHKCPDCDQAFKSKANLWSHKLKHQDERRYKCTFEGCKYTTYNNVYLQIHRVVHTGERPYKCVWPECGQAFKTSSNLWSHKLMHENERRYKCSFEGCDFAGNLLGNLQKHEETKHGKRSQKSSLNHQNLSNSISELKTVSAIEVGNGAEEEMVQNCVINPIGTEIENHTQLGDLQIL